LVVGSTKTDYDQSVIHTLLANGVAVHRDYVSDIASVYRAADVYVFPVHGARGAIDLPLSVLEALACGVPVVARPFGVLSDPSRTFRGLTLADGDLELLSAVERRAGAVCAGIGADVATWSDVARQQLALMTGLAA
jgi:glycosyltransferase involved in cell wall biosynthesis